MTTRGFSLAAGLLVAAIVAMGLARPAAAEEEAIAGHWVGTVAEVNLGTYVVAVTIHRDGKTGSVEYRHYPCGGGLKLIESEGGRHTFAETLSFGRKKCLDGLQVRMTMSGKDAVYFEEMVEGKAGVYGTLARVGGD